MKITDELQLGVPEHLFTDKTFEIDFSEFDLSDKDQKKLAQKKADKFINRFISRELRLKGKYWSRPKIDFENNSAVTTHSVVGDIATKAFYDAGLVYDFDVPIESEYDVAENWFGCH